MNMLDIDWVYMRATFLVVVALASVPCLFILGEKLDDRFGDKFYGYLEGMLRRYDERKARKTR